MKNSKPGFFKRLFSNPQPLIVSVVVEPMRQEEVMLALYTGRDTPLYKAVCQVIDEMQSEAAVEAVGFQTRGESLLMSGAVASMSTLAQLRSTLEELADARARIEDEEEASKRSDPEE